MSKLIEAIKAKLAADNLSPTAAAKSVGLSLPSFRAVLKGKSVPNARGLKKYAKLLGVSEDEVKALAGGGSRAKRRTSRRRGGRKPGRKPGRKVQGALTARVLEVLGEAERLLADDLAVAVHGLSKASRATVSMIVKNLH